MEEKITLCGDNCLECPRYNARTAEKLQAAAELWYRVGFRSHIVSNEEIACSGCNENKSCTYRLWACTKAHRVDKCNRCREFPCANITEMLSRSAAYEEKCRKVCSPKEYATLKKAFFEKEKNLKK